MSAAGTSRGLLRLLGYGFGVAVVIGSTIGSGILAAPGTLARELGGVGWPLVVWIAISVYALLGTMLMAELAVLMPRAGAWAAYAREAFGQSSGFVIGWLNWLMLAGTAASLAAFIAQLLLQLVPALGNGLLIALGTVIAFSVLQWTGTRASSRVQIVTSLLKSAAFVLLVGACLLRGKGGAFSEGGSFDGPDSSRALLLGLVASLQIVIFAFDGWYGAIYFAEEDRDPARNLPRSMIHGTWAIIAIYLLVVLAIFRVLPTEEIAREGIAAASAADVVFGQHGSTVILLISLISVPSVLNATLMQATRVLFALAREGGFFPAAGRVGERGTPVVALCFGSGATILLLLMNEGLFERLYAVTSYFMVILYLSGFSAFWLLRRRRADWQRPYRAPWHPWSTLYVVLVSMAFLTGALVGDTRNAVAALGMLVLAYPVHFVLHRRKR